MIVGEEDFQFERKKGSDISDISGDHNGVDSTYFLYAMAEGKSTDDTVEVKLTNQIRNIPSSGPHLH